MVIDSITIKQSGEVLPDNLDVVSEKIIVFGMQKVEGITFDGTFVLQEQTTMVDSDGEIITPVKWQEMVDGEITYKNKSYKVLNQSDPELELVVTEILQKTVLNQQEMKSRGVN